jgi:acyl-CoA thioesterase-1
MGSGMIKLSQLRMALGYGLNEGKGKVGLAIALVLGLSGPVLAQDDRIVIAAFGDSLTAGYGLPSEDGFVPQLQAWLAEQGADVVVQNAGVSGDTTAGGLSRVDWVLGPEVDAVVLELGANDMLRGLDAVAARDNLDAIMARMAERDLPVLVSGMRAPPNFGAEYMDIFNGMYADLAEKHGALLHPFFLQGLGSDVSIYELSQLMQPDGLHPNAEGVKLIVADIGPYVLELIGEINP